MGELIVCGGGGILTMKYCTDLQNSWGFFSTADIIDVVASKVANQMITTVRTRFELFWKTSLQQISFKLSTNMPSCYSLVKFVGLNDLL